MNTLLKYVLYACLLAIVVLFINSLFTGNITRDTNAREVVAPSAMSEEPSALDAAKEKASETWEDTKENVSKAGEYAAEKSGEAWDAAKEGVSDAGDAVSEKSGEAWHATKDAVGQD